MDKRIVILALLLAFITGTRAQNQRVILTLDTCYGLVHKNQTAEQNARLEVEKSRHLREMARTKYFPQISAIGCGMLFANPLLDFSASSEMVNANFQWGDMSMNVSQMLAENLKAHEMDMRFQAINSFSLGAVVALQPVYMGGRVVNANKMSELGVEVAQLRLSHTQKESEMKVEEYYWQAVSLNEKLQTIHQVQQLLDTLERDAESAYQAGVMGRNDLLKVRLAQSEAASTETKLRNGIAMVTMALCQYVGMTYDSEIEYVFDTLNRSNIVAPPMLLVNLNQAVANRNEALMLDKAVEAAALSEKMALGNALPNVMVGGSAFALSANTWISGYQGNGMLFATIQIPLTRWWSASHNIRRNRLEIQQMENRRKDYTEQMTLQTRQAWNELTESYEQISIKRQAVQEAEENFKEVKNYYDAGMYTMKDYLEAQTMLQVAQNSLTDQIILYQMKSLKYRQLTQGL